PATFNCPMCSAPLNPKGADHATMSCPYCSNTVLLPEELRGGASVQSSAGAPAGNAFGSMIEQAMHLAEVGRLIQVGNKIGAIKLYRETFGVGLKEAKDAVEKMERGEPVAFGDSIIQTENIHHASVRVAHPIHIDTKQVKKGLSIVGWIVGVMITVAVIGILIAVIGGVAAFVSIRRTITNITQPPSRPAPTQTQGFARSVLEFGSEGIGAGQFKDARTITVDGDGRIYVGEYTGGRVQVFDSQGKFITQWMVDPKSALLALAADRKGTIYVVHPSQLLIYEAATGKLIGEAKKPGPYHYEHYRDVFVALDGSLYAIGSNSNILHLSSDGQIENTIKVSEKIGEDVDFERVVVSGAGDIYALERRKGVFKFAADGRYVNRFGGEGEGDGPGQFSSANNIAVDGAGRIYVSDSGHPVHVFDGNGRYLDSFGESDVVFGLAINDHNEIFAMHRNKHKVIKYVLSKK
ncbi:MAG: hypothetical protein WBP93_16935, partial [Pyrinomonadaceae bacterium]